MERVEYSFPLVVWEQTDDYKHQLNAARARFAEPYGGSGSTYTPEVTFTKNCIPVVFKSTNFSYYKRGRFSATEGLVSAKRYGTSGYFRAEDLEDFRRGEGIVVEVKMDELGFRKHKKNPSKWVRKQPGENDKGPYSRHWEELFGTSHEIPDQAERARLQGLIVSPNVEMVLGQTYSISSGRTGLIFVELNANPFVGHSAETIGELGRQLAQKVHISRQQDGFTIEARNVRLSNDVGDGHDSVHVKAIIDDKNIEEVVWPARTHAQTIIDLAVNLRDRAGNKKS